MEYFDNIPIQIKQGDGIFVAYSNTPGGPVSTGKTKQEAISKYKEMHVLFRVTTQFLLGINNKFN